MWPPAPSNVAAAIHSCSAAQQQRLFELRELILSTAARLPSVGAIDETLKWGQPAYLTPETKSGTTIRLGRLKGSQTAVCLFVHCQTTLVDGFRKRFPGLRYEGNRAVVFDAHSSLPDEASAIVEAALTYHRT